MNVSIHTNMAMISINIKRGIRGLMTVAFAFAFDGLTAQSGLPDPMPVDANVVAAAKAALAKGDPVLKSALAQLVKRADAMLTFKPVSVGGESGGAQLPRQRADAEDV